MSYKNYIIRPDDAQEGAYSTALSVEYRQSFEEGLDVETWKDVFESVHRLPASPEKTAMANVLFDVVKNAPMRADYPYNEPSDLEGIRALRKPYTYKKAMPATKEELRKKISGAWYGRICGCLLGKPAEGEKYAELTQFLKDSDNFPMHRYIERRDIKYKSRIRTSCLADEMQCAPWDDDTNYMVIAQILLEKFGKDFTPKNVMDLWVERQPLPSYYTAEKVALLNYTRGFLPPVSAMYQNPYREWIGAQIRGDYFGYINPGDPEMAAEMAWRDASISHVKNGIYGEMFVSAMLAVAAVTDDLKDIILGGLAEIPATSRLYEAIVRLVDRYDAGVTKDEAFADIHNTWNDRNVHDWCHTISNALIVVASLLYGEGDYGRSICMAVETGFDTDCNGATVGSILGMRGGEDCIDEVWKKPTHGILDTTIYGAQKSEISTLVEKTMGHLTIEFEK